MTPTEKLDAVIKAVNGEHGLLINDDTPKTKQTILAALSFAKEMMLRPISEAPRDGTKFLMTNIKTRETNMGYFSNGDLYQINDGSGYSIDMKLFPAYTHYTPLPDKAIEQAKLNLKDEKNDPHGKT